MLTTLTVEERNLGKSPLSIIYKLIGDSVSVNIREYREITVREIIYKKRRKTIDLRKISEAAGAQRGCIICGRGIFEDGSFGLYRFYSPRFKQRLCTNFALESVRAMQDISRGLKIGVLDNNCACADIIRDFLSLCGDVTVVSSAIEEYEYIAEEIMSECGASFLLTSNPDSLNNCDLIIAPERISVPLSLRSQCVVLTVAPPRCPTGGQVYHGYKITLPKELNDLRPRECGEVYFASALYTKGRLHALGTLVPEFCSNSGGVQTVKSVASYLCAHFSKL